MAWLRFPQVMKPLEVTLLQSGAVKVWPDNNKLPWLSFCVLYRVILSRVVLFFIFYLKLIENEGSRVLLRGMGIRRSAGGLCTTLLHCLHRDRYLGSLEL